MTSRPLRVFLCHSSNDKPAVRELYQKLRAEPWIDPWLDEEELYPEQDYELKISKEILSAYNSWNQLSCSKLKLEKEEQHGSNNDTENHI
jgi:hypothetical protein